MTRGDDFLRNAKCKHGHRSTMSNSAWCDINKDCSTVLKLHDMCHNPECKCQKKNTFTPKRFPLECNCFEITMKKIFKGSQTAWNKFLKTAVNIAAPFIGLAVGAKTKNPKVAQATTNILRSVSGGKNLSPTDMLGIGLLLKVI